MTLFHELFNQFVVAIALGSQANGPPCTAGRHVLYGDEEIVLGHYLEPLFRPFNYTDSIAARIVLQPEAGNLADGIKTIKVDVV